MDDSRSTWTDSDIECVPPRTLSPGKTGKHTLLVRHLSPSACWIALHASLEAETVLCYRDERPCWIGPPKFFPAAMRVSESKFLNYIQVADSVDATTRLPAQEDVTTVVYRRPTEDGFPETLNRHTTNLQINP